MAAQSPQPRAKVAVLGRSTSHWVANQIQSNAVQFCPRRTLANWMVWGSLISIVAVASPSFAENWTIQPAASVRETWTDNVARSEELV